MMIEKTSYSLSPLSLCPFPFWLSPLPLALKNYSNFEAIGNTLT